MIISSFCDLCFSDIEVTIFSRAKFQMGFKRLQDVKVKWQSAFFSDCMRLIQVVLAADMLGCKNIF